MWRTHTVWASPIFDLRREFYSPDFTVGGRCR